MVGSRIYTRKYNCSVKSEYLSKKKVVTSTNGDYHTLLGAELSTADKSNRLNDNSNCRKRNYKSS